MTILGSDRNHLNRPQYEQLVTRLGLEELPVENESVREVISELDDVADNGGALLRKFQIVDEDGVFEYVEATSNGSIHNMLEMGGFLHDFLRSSELNESIDGLNTRDGFSGAHWNEEYEGGVVSKDGEQEFDWYHPFFVDGYLGWLLIRGGAYTDFHGTHAEAKGLGQQFEGELIDTRYEKFSVWRLQNVQWSEWFWGTIYWDETLILADTEEKIIWLFMFTASD